MSADSGLALHAAISAVAGLACTIVWGATGGGYYWPVWVWLGTGVSVALDGGLAWAIRRPRAGERAVAILGVLTAVIGVATTAIWGLAGGGLYWPAFPLVAMGSATAIVALVIFRPNARAARLTERVDQLTRSRRGALDVQAAELRRIERDLHDGAQARLVALSMHLGRAEERLEGQPEIADLVRRARGEAGAAIAELRDLARGIAPPVLADRGLAAAVEALGRRAPVPVTVAVELAERPPAVVETAAYFVVAEALTNVAKHAPQARARVAVSRHRDRLIVEVADDGPGGADAAGAGLTGLRNRAEAIDGTLSVTSAPTVGTVVRAELPCES